MSQKLSTITSTYHSFAKDQLLTHTDLNEVINYFEDQDRLTRISLNGVGIICGFKPKYDQPNNILYISQGTGVTTDGDLVKFLFEDNGVNTLLNPSQNSDEVQQIALTKYRNFTDNNAQYPPFVGTSQLLELLPATSTSPSEINVNIFEGRTLILYIDCYSKEPGACTSISCDSQGVEQIRVLRVLLVNDEDLPTIIENDSIFNNHNVIEDYLSMNEVALPRVILDESNTETVATLSDLYEDASTDSSIVTNISNNLQLIASRVDYEPASIVSNLSSIFSGSFPNLYFQYYYDLLKDVIDSHDEIRDLFISIFPECCPDISAFPKHLIIGKKSNLKDTLDLEDNIYRHGFYPSPLITQQYDAWQHLRALLGRVELMLGRFIKNLPGSAAIKISPSKQYTTLGNRAIPFYYDPQYDSDNNSSLVRIWDFNRKTLQQYNRIQGYHPSTGSSIPYVSEPLKYNLDKYDFFRIEGHQGKIYNDALEQINEKRDSLGLPFDTKVVGISVDGGQSIDLTEYACEFVDLKGQLESLIDAQNCVFDLASQFLSSYSITTEGLNTSSTGLMGYNQVYEQNYTAAINLVSVAPDSAPNTYTQPVGSAPVAGGGTYDQTTNAQYTDVPTAGGGDSVPIDQQYKSSNTEAAFSNETNATPTQQYYQIIDNTAYIPVQDAGYLQDFFNSVTVQDDLLQSENIIAKNLNIAANVLGKYVLAAFQSYLGTNAANVYAAIKVSLDDDDTVSAWETPIKNANLYTPAKILSSAYAATLLMPTKLENITQQVVSNYSTEVNRLCSYARQWKSNLTAVDGNPKITGDTKSMSVILNQSLTALCCAGERLQSILDQITDRKNEILANLQLDKFVEKHPALEHKAGVPFGGTFVMVYAFNQSGIGNIQNGTVIADFALPYMCCSDCTPVNFIVPRKTVSLLLSQQIICIDPSSSQVITIDMVITPGEAPVTTTEFIDGLEIIGNTIVITPAEFDASKIGFPIQFKVDGQPTNASLTVNEARDITVVPSVASTEQNPTGVTLITFIPQGANQSQDDITWDFGDGNTSTQFAPQHQFVLPIDEKPVRVTATVKPKIGGCESSNFTDIYFQPVKVVLDKLVFCNNEPLYPFTITPTGALPNIEGEGVVKTSSGYFFNPKIVEEGIHQIVTNDDDGNIYDVNVCFAPKGSVVATVFTKDLYVKLKPITETSNKFGWKFFANAQRTQEIPNVVFTQNEDFSIDIDIRIFEEAKVSRVYYTTTFLPKVPQGETKSPCPEFIFEGSFNTTLETAANAPSDPNDKTMSSSGTSTSNPAPANEPTKEDPTKTEAGTAEPTKEDPAKTETGTTEPTKEDPSTDQPKEDDSTPDK